MNFQEGTDDSGELTQQAFQNALNILDEEGFIAQMLFPARHESESQKQDNYNEWKQWTHEEFIKAGSIPQITIQEDRKFLYDEKHHHMWYKNINLPTITVSVHHESFVGGKYGILLDCFGVQIPEDQMLQSTSSKDCPTPSFVGDYRRFSLEGEGILQTILAQKSQHIFQRIKCKETSYNNKGLRFFIMLFIYEVQTNKPIIIRLSPSLYVESRKKSFQETLGFSHPFIPETLTKVYAKCSQLINQESIESFCEYYSSCSIRHKIIHPLFLYLKFSKGIKLYFNKHIIDEHLEKKQGTARLFFEIQCQIYSTIQKDLILKNPNGDDFKNQKPKAHKSSLFPLLGIIVNYESMPAHDKKSEKKIYQKIHRFVKPIVGSIVQVYYERKDIPNCMKEIAYKDHMKDDYKSIYHELADLKVKKSQSLGPSNTQYTHPHHQHHQSSQNQATSSNNQFDEYSSNESDFQENPKKSDKRSSMLTEDIKYKVKQNLADASEYQLLKKRPFNSLPMVQRCKISTTSGGEQNGNYNEAEEDYYDDDEMMEIDMYQQPKKLQQPKQRDDIQQQHHTNNNGSSVIQIQKSKKHSETTHTRHSICSNEMSDYEEYYDNAQNKNGSTRLNHERKETLSKIPEIPSMTNKENSTAAPTPYNSFPEYNSQTTIYPEQQQQTLTSMPFIQPLYSAPSMMNPYQNPYAQPIFIPINHYVPQTPQLHPVHNVVTPQGAAMGAPAAMQVVMNPYQVQNMYYPYQTAAYTMPMHAVQPQAQLLAPQQAAFMQPNLIAYTNTPQSISLQPNSQFLSQSKIQPEGIPASQQQQSLSQAISEKCL